MLDDPDDIVVDKIEVRFRYGKAAQGKAAHLRGVAERTEAAEKLEAEEKRQRCLESGKHR